MEAIQVEKEEKKKSFDKFEIEHMASVLVEAEEIKADPKKMAAVKESLSKKKSAIDSIDGLRSKRKEIMSKDQEEMDEEE